MKVFSLPSLRWFETGAEYSDSFGTDPRHGCMNVTIFRCRVKMAELRGERKLCAVCWYMLPWLAETRVDEMIVGCFEASEAGIEAAENWIQRKCFTYGADRLSISADVPFMPHKVV
jgi:hypothetical protein